MICNHCQKTEANVHYTEIVNNKVTNLHLCSRCAQEKGMTSSFETAPFSLANFLSGLAEIDTGLEGIPSPRTCSACGSSFEDFQESGRLGCAGCYDSFSKELLPLLKRIHGSTQHAGRMSEPKGLPQKTKGLTGLKRDLTQAIEKEKYERAAEIRDRIRELEKKGKEKRKK